MTKIVSTDRWYDRQTRSWVVQALDISGNQVGSAHYVYSKREAQDIQREIARENGIVLDFVRQPAPRHCEDYIATDEFGVHYCLWNSTDGGFGLSIRSPEAFKSSILEDWDRRTLTNIRWLRTKKRCVAEAERVHRLIQEERA